MTGQAPSRRRTLSRRVAGWSFGLAALLLLLPSGRTADPITQDRGWCAPAVFDLYDDGELDCTQGARDRLGLLTFLLLVAVPATVVYLDSRPDA